VVVRVAPPPRRLVLVVTLAGGHLWLLACAQEKAARTLQRRACPKIKCNSFFPPTVVCSVEEQQIARAPLASGWSIMASSPHVLSTVEIFAGRVVPHGYYKIIHRDSWYGDSAFYLRILGFAVFFTFLRLVVARWVVKVRFIAATSSLF
jgi:hypothetical protein